MEYQHLISDLYKHCFLCPRVCGVDRLSGAKGFCKESAELRIAAAVLHRGEEPPLVGTGGSGTIFVSGCNLGCAFCQNYQISQGEIISQGETTAEGNTTRPLGRAVSAGGFAEICLELQNRGGENINIVTGSHSIPALVQGIIAARDAGLRIPILWNSSAYESPQALELLKDHVDIYLPDLKTLDSELSSKFCNAPDYPRVAATAILKMMDMAAMRRAEVIIRHLILPGYLESTRSVLRWFAEYAKGRALLSLMTQYTPIKANQGRYLNKQEYETVLGWLGEFGIDDGFCQELVTGNDWLPDFRRPNPFSSELSVPVWHWSQAQGPTSPASPR